MSSEPVEVVDAVLQEVPDVPVAMIVKLEDGEAHDAVDRLLGSRDELTVGDPDDIDADSIVFFRTNTEIGMVIYPQVKKDVKRDEPEKVDR